jgi:hypothetical protein
MSILTANVQMTMMELAKRHDPKGNAATIAEVLAETNEILYDAPWLEANDVSSHKIVRRTTLPSGSWRRFNAGVATEMSKTMEVIEGIGMLESYSEMDAALWKLAANPSEFRMQENRAFLEGMGQTMADTMISGNTVTNIDRFDGFATRLPSLAATTNVIGSGGTGSDLSSIYIVQWGIGKVYMTYPRGSGPGAKNGQFFIQHRDLGEDTKGTSTLYQVVRDHFKVSAGLVVHDDRCIARLANMESASATNSFDEDNLIKLLNRMPMSGSGASLYVNDETQSRMEIRLKDKTNVNFTPAGGEGLAGNVIVKFRGNPIRKVDAITNTEAALT